MTYYKVLKLLYAWLAEEEEIPANPMARMRPPIVPDRPVPIVPEDGAWYLVLGQGYDSRWRATMDGQPLGPPIAVDGWSTGWRISDPRAHQIAVELAPGGPQPSR